MAFESALDAIAAALGTNRDAAGYLLGMILILIIIVCIVLILRNPMVAMLGGYGIGNSIVVLLAWWPVWTVIATVMVIALILINPFGDE